jgi:hypothetical protein
MRYAERGTFAERGDRCGRRSNMIGIEFVNNLEGGYGHWEALTAFCGDQNRAEFDLHFGKQKYGRCVPEHVQKVWRLCTRGRDGLHRLLAAFTYQERSETPTDDRHLTGCNIQEFI